VPKNETRVILNILYSYKSIAMKLFCMWWRFTKLHYHSICSVFLFLLFVLCLCCFVCFCDEQTWILLLFCDLMSCWK